MAVDVRQWWGHGVTRARSFLQAPRAGDWLRPLPVLVNTVLVVLIAWTASDLTWSILSPRDTTVPAVEATSSRSAAAGERQSTSVDDLAALHLFGQAEPGQVARAAPIDAPETRLNLKLRGVFATAEPREALAIIGEPQGKEKPYRVGDALPGGAELHQIYADRVILDRGGQLETLKLQRSRLPEGARQSAGGRQSGSAPAPLPADGQGVSGEASARLQALRERYAGNPDELWNEVRITPVMGDGGVRGYTLQHQDRELMNALGLQPDDVITEVNGMPLSDPSAMYEVMNTLSSAQSLTLAIERNGAPQTVQVSLD